MTLKSQGAFFRAALAEEKPLQIAGAINAYSALLAARSGFKALYLSGSGVATASHGLPDLGLTNLQDVLDDASRITSTTDLPLLVDIDTGWGNGLSIARTIKSMIKAEVAAVHIEDQVMDKRCGHRPNKQIVPMAQMLDRIKAAVDARTDPDFLIMARTDAIAVEGLEAGIERACRYIEAGADAVFPDAITKLSHYQQFVNAVKKPVLANMTEFGKTPLLELDELKQAGVAMVLYPLSAFRAMSQAAINVYNTIRQEGSQKAVLPLMQTREELYDCLDYERYESLQDQ